MYVTNVTSESNRGCGSNFEKTSKEDLVDNDVYMDVDVFNFPKADVFLKTNQFTFANGGWPCSGFRTDKWG